MLDIVVKIVHFRIIGSVTENEFLAASNIMMKELGSFDGFIDRELVKRNDGSWTDISHWENMDAAKRALKATLKFPLCLEYLKLIEESSIEMNHCRLIQHFG